MCDHILERERERGEKKTAVRERGGRVRWMGEEGGVWWGGWDGGTERKGFEGGRKSTVSGFVCSCA